MKKLTIFAMSEKGFEVVNAIVSTYPELVDAVVGSRDDNVVDDCYARLQGFCIANAVPFFDRRERRMPGTKFALAVSWRWLIDPGPGRLIACQLASKASS